MRKVQQGSVTAKLLLFSLLFCFSLRMRIFNSLRAFLYNSRASLYIPYLSKYIFWYVLFRFQLERLFYCCWLNKQIDYIHRYTHQFRRIHQYRYLYVRLPFLYFPHFRCFNVFVTYLFRTVCGKTYMYFVCGKR